MPFQLNANIEAKQAEYESNIQFNANQVCELNSQLMQKDCVIETLRSEAEKARLDSTNTHRENEQKISQLEENLRQKERQNLAYE